MTIKMKLCEPHFHQDVGFDMLPETGKRRLCHSYTFCMDPQIRMLAIELEDKKPK